MDLKWLNSGLAGKRKKLERNATECLGKIIVPGIKSQLAKMTSVQWVYCSRFPIPLANTLPLTKEALS